jgi:hypothetical protein
MKKKDFGFQDLHELLKKTIEESDKRMQKLEQNDAKFQKKLELSNAQFQEKLDKLSEFYGGLSNNIGEITEETFASSLEQSMSLGKMTFDIIDRNLKRSTKHLKEEYDIILTNKKSKLIVEVKQKFHPNDVEKLLRKLDNYKIMFPNDKNYVLYGAAAALKVPDETIEKAKTHGLFVLTQQGNALRVINDPIH